MYTPKVYGHYADNITEANCNARLTFLYNKRDETGKSIDRATMKNDHMLVEAYEKMHSDICNTIDKLLEFRRNHNCLLEGDPGYGL